MLFLHDATWGNNTLQKKGGYNYNYHYDYHYIHNYISGSDDRDFDDIDDIDDISVVILMKFW